MDGLCKLTARMQGRKTIHNIPPPDYDSTPRSQGSHQPTIVMEEKDTCYEGDERQDSLSPEQIRSMMSREQKELQRDLKIMQKRGVDLKSKRPEFKVKHHEIMSKGTQRRESKEAEESELSTKLRTRSEKIQKAENAQKVEDEKPEFMKVRLTKGKGAPTV